MRHIPARRCPDTDPTSAGCEGRNYTWSHVSFPEEDQRPEEVFTMPGRKICVKSDFT